MANTCWRIEPKKALAEYICEHHHHEYAVKCAHLLSNFDNLRVYEARCHGEKPYPYTCWYVGFKHILEEKVCFILHFEIRRSNIYVYFRFLDYVTQDVLTNGAWGIRGRWKYLHFRKYERDESRLVKIIKEYLERIEPHYDKLDCRKRSPCD